MKEKVTVKTINGIKVTTHIPLDVSEWMKRNRINQIYDILKPHEEYTKGEKETNKSKKGDSNSH